MDNKPNMIQSTICFVTVSMFWLLGASSASALELTLAPPGDREFVRDLANMIDSEAEAHIRQLCDSLLTDKATPIIVVTIDSMAANRPSRCTCNRRVT